MSINRRSKNITQGVARSPNRAMYVAMGYKDEDFNNPMIGIANGHSTITVQQWPAAPGRRSGGRREIGGW